PPAIAARAEPRGSIVRTFFCIFVVIVWLVLMFPLACLLMLATWRSDNAIWVARRLFSPVVLWAGGARLVVSGREHADPSRPTVYLSNHQSTSDIPALLVALPVNVRFVAKKQLQWVPIVGQFLHLAGHIVIDRSNTRSAIASLDAAARKIRAGTSIVLFPEGTRSPDGRILPFKKGPFALALKAGAAICPVTIEGSGKLMPKRSWRIFPGKILVKIGEPIDASKYGEKDRERLMKTVRTVMIAQSLELGGKGGDPEDAIAARGVEGPGRSNLGDDGDGDDDGLHTA
ncbi:MAG TPA: lysophospholipid acyltransferase family protein, partial [Myxococcaceae bacterium]|nr:lysophospholipid acyltransferase family protein [Myxococcaceae bacterium]